MTRLASKTKTLVTVISFLIFAETAPSQGVSNLHPITEENGSENADVNGSTLGHVREATYVVDQAAPGAADTNPGTEQMPFKTVQRAALATGNGQQIES